MPDPALPSAVIPQPYGHGRDMRDRVPQLDSLRGVAAATVIVHHFHNAFHVTDPPWWLYPLMAGHEAVILFFVLSGYVLSLPAWTGRQQPYPEYLARRLCRIYLPYLGGLALAAMGCWFFLGRHPPGLTYWFYLTWQQPLSARMLFDQVLMDPRPLLNTAFWSLRYEMQMSLVFPAFCLTMRRLGRWSGLGLMVATRLIASLLNHTGNDHGYKLTFFYAFFFLAGAAIAKERYLLTGLVRRSPAVVLWSMFGFALAVYFIPGMVLSNFRTSQQLAGIGAAALILLVQDDRLRVGLRSRVAEYLGRISYSSYLVHGTVLFVLLDTLYGFGPLWLLAVVYVVVTLAVSHAFCVAVEEPGMRLGKRLAKRITALRGHKIATDTIQTV